MTRRGFMWTAIASAVSAAAGSLGLGALLKRKPRNPLEGWTIVHEVGPALHGIQSERELTAWIMGHKGTSVDSIHWQLLSESLQEEVHANIVGQR